MTRLQNAKNDLVKALAALESAASQAINASYESNTVAGPSQMGAQTAAGADLSTLVDEVSIIEAKLSEAVAMIAKVDAGTVGSGKANGGDTQ